MPENKQKIGTRKLPSIRKQIAFVQRLRAEIKKNHSSATVVWEQDDITLQQIEENLISVRNMDCAIKKEVSHA